jgi:di/tricarboxylate transporter
MLTTSLRIVALGAVMLASGSALAGFTPGLWQAALLSLSIILLWATGALPEDQTALIFFVGASLLGLVRPEIIFSGFASSAFWLVFGGLVIGAAVRRCGLDLVIARPFLAFARGAYWRAVIAVILISLVLSALVPSSMTRVVLSIPVVLALCEQLGLGDGRGKLGLITATVLSSYYFGSGLLPANVPNMALVGSAEKILPVHFRFAEYFITYFPVLGLVKTALTGCLIAFAFNVPVAKAPVIAPAIERDDNRRWLVGLVLIAALLFWVTDFLHGVSPAWIAMIAALIFLFPGVDVVPLDQFGRLVNVRPLFFVAGILGLGSFIAASGLGAAAAHHLSAWAGLRSDGSLREVILLTGISTTLGLLATHGGMAALMPSLVKDLAAASGLTIETVIGTIVLGYSILLLPYQVPPSIVGFQMAAVSPRAAALATLSIGLVTSMVAIPLQLMWWHVIGFF